MERFKNQLPPVWAIALLRLIVHPTFREEIEGDVLEKYLSDSQRYGQKVAQKRFYRELFSLLRPNLIFNINQIEMKSRNWLTLLLIAIAIVVAAIAPFLPGPRNSFSHSISQFAQTIGYIGLAFTPFGLIWLFIEIRNNKEQSLNRWTNGYYPSWLTMIPVFLFLILQVGMAIHEGWTFNVLPLTFLLIVLVFLVYRIQKLKRKISYKFNPVPLYIVLIPLIALLTSKFAVEKAAAFSRKQAIEKTEPLLTAIEKYKTEHGQYPASLEELEQKYIPEIPKFNLMGIRAYQYEQQNNSFYLSFEQYWHWNATEVVFYDLSGQKIIKNNYENFNIENTNWRYYLAD